MYHTNNLHNSRSTRRDLPETTSHRWVENSLWKDPVSSKQGEDRMQNDEGESQYSYRYNDLLRKNEQFTQQNVMVKKTTTERCLTEEQERNIIVSNCNNNGKGRTMPLNNLAAELENRLTESLNLQAALRMKLGENDAMTRFKHTSMYPEGDRLLEPSNVKENNFPTTTKKLIDEKEEEIMSISQEKDCLQKLLDGCLIEYSKYMTKSNEEYRELKSNMKEKDDFLNELKIKHESVNKDNELLKKKWTEYLIGFNQTLSEMDKKSDELKSELCENKKLLSELRETCMQKNDENNEIKRQLNASTMKLHRTTMEMNEMNAELDVKENQLSKLHDRFKKMAITYRENEERLKNKQSEVEEMKTMHDREVKILQESINKLKSENEISENFCNNEHLKEKILELESELKVSKDSLSNATIKHQYVMATLESQCNNRLNEMKDALLNLQTELDEKDKSLRQCISNHKLEKEKMMLECNSQTELKVKLHKDIVKRKTNTIKKLRKDLEICKHEILENNKILATSKEKELMKNGTQTNKCIMKWLKDSKSNSISSISNCSVETAEIQSNDTESTTAESHPHHTNLQVKELQLRIVDLRNDLLSERKSSTEMSSAHSFELVNIKERYNNRVEEVKRKMKVMSEEEVERHHIVLMKLRRELIVCKEELNDKNKTIDVLNKKAQEVDRVVFQRNSWFQKCEQLDYGYQELQRKYNELKMECEKNKQNTKTVQVAKTQVKNKDSINGKDYDTLTVGKDIVKKETLMVVE